MHDPRLVLSPSNDAHLTSLLLKYSGLVIALSVDSFQKSPIFQVCFTYHDLNTAVTAETLDKAYKIAYAEFGMNTGLW